MKAREQRQISVTLKMARKFAHFLQIEPRDSRSLHFFQHTADLYFRLRRWRPIPHLGDYMLTFVIKKEINSKEYLFRGHHRRHDLAESLLLIRGLLQIQLARFDCVSRSVKARRLARHLCFLPSPRLFEHCFADRSLKWTKNMEALSKPRRFSCLFRCRRKAQSRCGDPQPFA